MRAIRHTPDSVRDTALEENHLLLFMTTYEMRAFVVPGSIVPIANCRRSIEAVVW
jgi:hypothetical protein